MRRAFSVAVYARRSGRVLVIHHRRLATWLPLGGELPGVCDGVPPGLRWVDRAELMALDSPRNVREFGLLALDAELQAG